MRPPYPVRELLPNYEIPNDDANFPTPDGGGALSRVAEVGPVGVGASCTVAVLALFNGVVAGVVDADAEDAAMAKLDVKLTRDLPLGFVA